jgi:hypothetical protein
MIKNHQYQHQGKPHRQEKYQGAAISVEDAIIIFRGLNLCGIHCTWTQRPSFDSWLLVCKYLWKPRSIFWILNELVS